LDIDGSFEDDGAQTLSLDDNADFSTNDTLSIGDDNDTLSFDTDGAETLSLDSDDTLGFEGSDNLSLPDESFSIDEDEDELGVDDDDDEVESSRPTTEIIDEDEVNFVFPLLVLVSFGLIIFNGMIIFGMLQELGGDSSVATGENFYASIKDFVTSNFPSPK
jgi:hypothetical protein